MKTEIIEHTIAHPAESIFDITPGSTVVDQIVTVPETIIDPVQYDEKDQEIDQQLQQVFEAGFGAFESQRLLTEGMNPQFANRALEVAAQFLNTALAAINAKANFKQNKDKNNKTVTTTSNNTTNNVIMDRNQMLAMLMKQQTASSEIIDIDED